MQAKSNIKKPDRIILFEIGLILSLLFVNYALNLKYQKNIVVEDQFEIDHDDTGFVYTPPKPFIPQEEPEPHKEEILEKAEFFDPTDLIKPVNDLFKTIESKMAPAKAPIPGKIGPIKVAPISEPSTTIDTWAQEMPQFPGGDRELSKYIRDNFQIPDIFYDITNKVELLVEFIIDEKGEVTDIKILKCSKPGLGAEREAKRLYSRMPKWTPGNNGKNPVKVRLTQPVKIVIYE